MPFASKIQRKDLHLGISLWNIRKMFVVSQLTRVHTLKITAWIVALAFWFSCSRCWLTCFILYGYKDIVTLCLYQLPEPPSPQSLSLESLSGKENQTLPTTWADSQLPPCGICDGIMWGLEWNLVEGSRETWSQATSALTAVWQQAGYLTSQLCYLLYEMDIIIPTSQICYEDRMR